MIEWNSDIYSAPRGIELLVWWQGEAYKAFCEDMWGSQRWFLDGATGFDRYMSPSHWAHIDPPVPA